MEISQKIAKPIMPDHITILMPAGKKQDGMNFDNQIPIEKLTQSQAMEYAELMKKTFMEHWQNSLPQSAG